LALAAAVASGCTQPTGQPAPSTTVIATGTPEPPTLGTPEDAVKSYLDWISFSYRSGSSEDSSPTMTAEEGVRVDSYIELNRQKDRFIEQALKKLDITDVKIKGASATVTANEVWDYRYVTVSSGKPGPTLSAEYTTTYTLKQTKDGWVVATVQAQSDAPVQ